MKRPIENFFGYHRRKSFWKSVRSDFRSLFVAGLLVIIPVWVTFLTIKFLVGLMDQAIVLLPRPLRPEHLVGEDIPGIGVLITVFFILVVGFFARNYFGKRFVHYMELAVDRTPLVRGVYSAIKQFTAAIFGDSRDQFRGAVMFEYPRHGVWSIGFVTNRVARMSNAGGPENALTVFLPTTPNPTSGWFLVITEDQTVPLDISIEDAFKIIISGGVVLPGFKVAGKDGTAVPAAPKEPNSGEP
ncbi:DUF502 domain-containing protein [bacterium]|nr:DUF502 domain-containing protein [bacterium]